MTRFAACAAFALSLAPAAPAAGSGGIAPGAWSVSASEGVEARIAPVAPARGVALAYDFAGRGGWAGVKAPLAADLPENWELSFRLSGSGGPNTLEVKFVDPSGENVWWWRRTEAKLAAEPERVVVPRRRVSFAWGPAGGGMPSRLAGIEFVLTPGTGGAGTLRVEDVLLTSVPPPAPPGPATASASSFEPGHPPSAAVDGAPETAWRSGGPAPATLTLDFGALRDAGGLAVTWEPGFEAASFTVRVSADGTRWREERRVAGARGPAAFVRFASDEVRYARLELGACAGAACGVRDARLLPAEAARPAGFFREVAHGARRGLWPRAFAGEQVYWSIAGSDGGPDTALLSEDGALEPGTGSFSVEPFLLASGRLVTWADVESEPSLLDGFLPVPCVTWRAPGLTLEMTVFGDGEPERRRILARYRVTNVSTAPASPTLVLALRPLLVNPPEQFLGAPAGAVTLPRLTWDGVRASAGARPVVPLRAASAFGATPFDAGEISSWLARGTLPPAASVEDPAGFASGALEFSLAPLAPGAAADVVLEIPFPGGAPAAPPASADGGAAYFEARLAAVRAEWREKLTRVELALPASEAALGDILRASLGFTLVTRDGAALRPGSRSYARSWIRDGAMMAAAFVRLGHVEAARDFALWFAPFQFASGRVPCCVDRRGADPVPEHDSHGELLYLAGEVMRAPGGEPAGAALFPHVSRAVDAIDALRATRRTPDYASGARHRFFGLLPESISHEGYSAKPVHSYWDDFWALRGLADAVFLAQALGRPDEARRWAASREEFRSDLGDSIARTRAESGVPFVPGSADLADFDPTSTSVLLDPAEAEDLVPREALDATWDAYMADLRARRDGRTAWDVLTPYELRNVGALVRLGRREDADEALAFLVAGIRPRGFRQWAEVVYRDARAPHFLGDLPHAWVATDFIRAFLDFFAYRRDAAGQLVVAAGIPGRWLAGGEPVGIRGLRTPWGVLTYTMRESGGTLRVEIEGGLRVPPGGLVLKPPGALREATVDGSLEPVRGGAIVVRRLPATVVIRR